MPEYPIKDRRDVTFLSDDHKTGFGENETIIVEGSKRLKLSVQYKAKPAKDTSTYTEHVSQNEANCPVARLGSRSGYNKTMGYDVVGLGTAVSMPDVLRSFLKKWTDFAREETDFVPYYYIKYAGIVFRYKNIWYRMGPGSIGITEETLVGSYSDVANELFEHFEGKMKTELVSLGAEDVFYSGMMD
mgnify:CR=1 FL=1|jgi:hypothetical protein